VMGAVDVLNFVKALQALGNNRNNDQRGVMIAGVIKGFCDTATALAEMREALDAAKGARPFAAAGAAFGRQSQGATVARATKSAQTLKLIGHVGNIIGMGLTLRSLSENIEQNDDAWIPDALAFSSAAIGTLGGTVVGAELLALVGISTAWVPVVSIALLAVSYLASLACADDTPFEDWLTNGPFNKDKADRFGGHAPGSDPMDHAQLPRAGGHKHIDDPNPDSHRKYRYAMWCEKPDEAYLALMDALYRPQITSKEYMLNSTTSRVRMNIHTPYWIPEKSKLFIQFSLRDDHYAYRYTIKEGEKTRQIKQGLNETFSIASGDTLVQNGKQPDSERITVESLRTGPNQFTIERSNTGMVTCELKVRLDLYGDQKHCLPFEPALKGSDVGTDDSGSKWVEVTQVFDKPRMQRLGGSAPSDIPATI
ncbi:MAG TPA: hypothetical protein VET88_00310, partial [Gammaproteobacteria bacterium]|nr:hypothetical protein [Gammaproteobacteria bacterium]